MEEQLQQDQPGPAPVEQSSLAKRFSRELLKILAGVALGLAVLAGLLVGVPAGMNWNAEKKAGAFCESVKRGADVSAMAANFEKNLEKSAGERILQYDADDASSHTFLFEGFMFDKAACRVAMDKDRKAVSAHVLAAQ
jgi:hypothetical protein